MAKRLIFSLLLLLFVLPASLLTAQVNAGDVFVIPGESRAAPVGKTPFENQLNELWLQALSSANRGDLPDAELYIKQMLVEARRYDITTLPEYSWAAQVMEHESADSGDKLSSQFYQKAARDLGSNLPEIHFFLVKESFKDGTYGPMFKEFFSGVIAIITRDGYALPLTGNIIAYYLASLYFLCLIFALVLFFKYIPRLWHDVQEFFHNRAQAFLKPILGIILFLLPLALGFDLKWLIVYFMVLLYGYASSGERTLIIAFLIMGILTPSALYLYRQEFRLHTSPLYEATAALNRNELVYNYIGNIETINNIVGEDADLMFLIANMYDKSGDTPNALTYYQKTVDKVPGYKEAFINLGNIYFRQNQFESAIDRYKKAIQADSSYIEAYYNLNIAYKNNYQFDEAQAILRDASAINRRAVNRLMIGLADNDVSGEIFSRRSARKKYHELNRNGDLKGKEIRGHVDRDTLFHNLLHPLFILALLGMVACIGLDKFRTKRGDYAGVCTKCGHTFCNQCRHSSDSNIYCTQCVHIYIKKDGVPLEVKVKKMKEVNRFLRFNLYIHKILNIFLPGTASLMKGSPMRGVLVLFIVLFCMTLILMPALFPILRVTVISAEFLRKIAMGVIILTWLISNIRSLLDRGGV